MTDINNIFNELAIYERDFSTGDIDGVALIKAIDELRDKYTNPLMDAVRSKFITALKCCVVNRNGEDCDSCPYLHGTTNTGCVNALLSEMLDALERGII